MNATDTSVTVIGLGLMGQALARVFLKAGHPTTVWNRTAAKAEPLAKLGAKIVKSAADLGPATERIADELNKQYTIGYSSSKPPDGGWRPLRVRVRTGGYFVRARRGYFALPAR